MESWDVLVLGEGPAALRAAIAASDAGARPLLVSSCSVGAASGFPPISGFSASLNETSPSSHIQDTISAGGDGTDKEAATRICSSAVEALSELERWGLVLRRSQDDLPHLADIFGHTFPRVAGCGDSTIREVTRTLEEQTMKRAINRKSDLLPVALVMDNKQARGIIALDIESGNLIPIQAKTIIIASQGYHGIWNAPSQGHGNGLAISNSAGISLRGMANAPMYALTISGVGMVLPMDILGSGGRIRKVSGEDASPLEVIEGEPCVLDMRSMERSADGWFENTSSKVLDRVGLDIRNEVLPISPRIVSTTGGIPVDDHCRATFDSGKMWYTGLYAAGRSAYTGMHGLSPLPGNLIMEEVVTGAVAGKHAGEWSKDSQFGGHKMIDEALSESQKKIDQMFSSEGSPVGHVAKALSSAMRIVDGSGEQSSMAIAQASINEIASLGIRVTDPSRRMNTELVTALHVEGLLSLAMLISSNEEEE
ncbi:MAG: FAD-binding protein [Candidatus Thalassarchaeaceae archaeon]|tara:strand:+ start:10193 stop:11635 length:1443 start_codon:yes stop_codon:yes gene_type:complete